jgi:anti-anti-sigma factor
MPTDAALAGRIDLPGEDPAYVNGPPQPSDLVIAIRPPDAHGRGVVALRGDLDVNAAGRVRVALAGSVHVTGCRALWVDLGDVEFVDSVGLGALVAGYHAARTVGVGFALASAQPPVRRALEVTGLAGPLRVAGSLPGGRRAP